MADDHIKSQRTIPERVGVRWPSMQFGSFPLTSAGETDYFVGRLSR